MVTLTLNGKTWEEPSFEEALYRIQLAEVIEGFDLKIDSYSICIAGIVFNEKDLEELLCIN